MLGSFLSQPWVDSLGWTLLHFVWQGALIALILAAILIFLRRSTPQKRYAAACLAMLSMVVSATATLLGAYPVSSSSQPIPTALKDPATPASIFSVIIPAQSPLEWLGVTELFQALLPGMLLIWFVGVSLLSIRLLGGWLVLQSLKAWGVEQIEPRWQEKFRTLGQQLHLKRPVRLLGSKRIQVSLVIGWVRPVVLIPMGMLVGLAPQQIEAILLHELAHIRRYDYLVNILQTIVETLFFYHPAVWWVSLRMKTEREYCCDDQVVSVHGDPLVYAHALAQLEELRSESLSLSIAANGGSLLYRLQRLVVSTSPSPQTGNRLVSRLDFRSLGANCLILSLFLSLSCGTARLSQAPPGNYDLVALEVRHHPEHVKVGDEVAFTRSLANKGADTVPARTFNVDLYLDGKLIGFDHATHHVDPLGNHDPDSTWVGRQVYSMAEGYYHFRPTKPGIYKYKWILDKENNLHETDETNNVIEGTIAVEQDVRP